MVQKYFSYLSHCYLTFYAPTKHIEIDYHFTWEKVAQLHVHFISSIYKIVDIFT